MESLPKHLQKYIVEQNYEKYTPVDQACWRYILRQLKAFLGKHAHECYLEGLEKTGIEIERIPKIFDISAKISKFGWRALPVSGFIPPAAFMELQSLGVLPIASDMRTIDHLEYTPAPDIVHEAAGHAPILIHPEFAQYLKEYAQVARKAIISKEDLDLYEAIRELSDVKENPESTPQQIEAAQKALDKASASISHVSEAAELGRMNWWTAEYGLIGELHSPKIFGAGLLSSVGESRWCLSDKVKKIPLTVDCINVGYDITEPQPQLFVAPDFKTLSEVLHQMAEKMAFMTGGLSAVKKAIDAKSVNTIELDSGLQISGVCAEASTEAGSDKISYLKFSGPTQLSYKDQELPGHDKNYHQHGFGTPVGFLKNFPHKPLSEFSDTDLKSAGLSQGQPARLEFASGVIVEGILKSSLRKEGKLLVLAFENCKVTLEGQILFDPAWGTFDMAVGTKVISVFGGPADRAKYGETEDFVARRVPAPKYSEKQKLKHALYQQVRDLREKKESGQELVRQLEELVNVQQSQFPAEWLLLLEAYELLSERQTSSPLKAAVFEKLNQFKLQFPEKKTVIDDGLALLH